MFTRYSLLLLLLLVVVVVVLLKYIRRTVSRNDVHQIFTCCLLAAEGRVGWVVAEWVGAAPRCGVGGGNGRVL